MIKKLIESLSLFTLAGLVFSYISLQGYYFTFGVYISRYISASELLVDLLPYSFILMFVFWALGASYEETQSAESSFMKDMGEFMKLIFMKKVSNFPLFLLISICLLAIGVLLAKFSSKEELAIFFLLLGLSIMLFGGSHKIWFGKRTVSHFKALQLFAGFGIACIITFLVSVFVGEARLSSKQHPISFKYNEQVLQTDSNLIWIGTTENYFFLYNKSSSRTTILRRSNIDSISYFKGVKK